MASNNVHRIAKNTGLLYFRSIVVLIISLYTSRVLLANLGIDDYGLYNLVGGVVGLFTSLQGIFAFSVQRFLSFAKGEHNPDKENLVFNISLYIHIAIAIIFALIVECFGMWFIPNKLNIEASSMSNAMFVFHASIATAVISILITPFSASIIANERMNVYAWLSVIDAILKLLIILVLPFFPFEPIRIYAILLLSISILNLIVYVICCRDLQECKIRKRFEKNIFKEIASFAGWDFAGNTAWAMINEGVNMILNIFGGVALNAARGIAYQVKNAVLHLTNNVMVASRPRIIQQAANSSKDVVFKSVFFMARGLFLIMSITALPIMVYCDDILALWLLDVPNYSIGFVRLVLLWNILRALNTPIDLAFTAYGKVKVYQIFNALTLLLNLPLSYILLKMGFSYYYAFLAFSIVEVIDIAVNLIVARKVILFDVEGYLKNVIVPCFWNGIIIFLVGLFFYRCLNFDSLGVTLGCIILLVVSVSLLAVTILINKQEKKILYPIITSFLNKIGLKK